MKLRLTALIAVIMMLINSPIISQTNRNIKHHAFSGTLMLGAEAGVSLAKTDYNRVRPDIMGRGVLEYFFPTTNQGIFGIKGFVLAGYIGGEDNSRTSDVFRTNMTGIGGDLTYTFSIEEAVFPYVGVGATYLWFNPRDNNDNALTNNLLGKYDKQETIFQAELGLRFLLSKSINMNLGLGGYFSPHDNWDDLAINGNNDYMVTIMAGIAYSFFTTSDSDGDGIEDSKDMCANTPKGVDVDEYGCPLDKDGDGVPDYKDKCPNTKSGMEVDETGCAIDADNDGVPDKLDKCPNTPAGMQVNEQGCPDTDGDGVYDNSDKCPGTPQGAAVDDTGCPKDSDNDGVPDFKDKCPNTPAGKQVDEDGCAKADTVVKKITLSGDTNFEFNKATLLPSAYPTLDNLAKTMKDNSNTRWRVEGYTDAVGSDSYNMDLSRRRAQSVVDYLINKGIDRSRLEVVPYGESNPVASNDTPEGRAMNRRVEIKVIENNQ